MHSRTLFIISYQTHNTMARCEPSGEGHHQTTLSRAAQTMVQLEGGCQ